MKVRLLGGGRPAHRRWCGRLGEMVFPGKGRSDSSLGVQENFKKCQKLVGKGILGEGMVQGCKCVVPHRWAVEHRHIPE